MARWSFDPVWGRAAGACCGLLPTLALAVPQGGAVLSDFGWGVWLVGLPLLALVAGLWAMLRRYRGRLEQAERRSRYLMEEAPFPVVITRPDDSGQILYINRCTEDYYGISRHDLVGKSAIGFWRSPEQRGLALAEIRSRGGRWQGFEVELKAPDRPPVWVLMSAALIEFRGEEALMSSFQDITQRKQVEMALGQSERRFRTLAESAYDVIWTMDLEGRFTYVSPSVQRLRGYTPEEVMQQSLAQALTPESAALACEGFSHLLRTGKVIKHHWELEQPCKDGSTVWTDLIVNALRDEAGELCGVIGIARDITLERQMRQELVARGVAIDAAAEGVLITDREGRIEYANPALCQMTGFAPAEIMGRSTALFKSGVHGPEFYQQMWATITAGQPWRGEVINRRKDGSCYHELLAIAPVQNSRGEVERFVAIKHDISERKGIEQRLEHLAHFDQLTDLPNRALFFDRLGQAYALFRRYGEGGAVLLLDLDGFKAVNDTLGHQAGDQLLQAFARRLEGTLRQSDTAARMGGDEFTVLLHDVRRPSDSVAAAEKILQAVKEPFLIQGQPCRIGVSIGIALFDPGHVSADALLQAADKAMYAAKRAGKNRYALAGEPQGAD